MINFQPLVAEVEAARRVTEDTVSRVASAQQDLQQRQSSFQEKLQVLREKMNSALMSSKG